MLHTEESVLEKWGGNFLKIWKLGVRLSEAKWWLILHQRNKSECQWLLRLETLRLRTKMESAPNAPEMFTFSLSFRSSSLTQGRVTKPCTLDKYVSHHHSPVCRSSASSESYVVGQAQQLSLVHNFCQTQLEMEWRSSCRCLTGSPRISHHVSEGTRLQPLFNGMCREVSKFTCW